MENEKYRLWEVLGVWASAIATVAAVVVSLWLARRAERPALRIVVEKMLWLDPAKIRDLQKVQSDEMLDIISLDVTNIGMSKVRINSVGWHWLLLKAKGALQNPPDVGFRSQTLPAILDHGDQLQWALPYSELVTKLAENMLADSVFWRIRLRLLRVVVFTSTGQRFRSGLGPELRKAFAKETSRLRKSR